jgi:RNA polymerase subunit RPABC4/transcription elongation factor Spt4
MTLPPNLNVYVSAALFVLGAYIFALYAGLIIWTFRDIHARSRDVLGQIMATLLVAVFTLPGLLIYVLVRPRTTLADTYERDLAEEALLKDLEQKRACPKCQRRVEADFIVCPNCKEQLKLRCISCERLLSPEWDICPYCGQITDSSLVKDNPTPPTVHST